MRFLLCIAFLIGTTALAAETKEHDHKGCEGHDHGEHKEGKEGKETIHGHGGTPHKLGTIKAGDFSITVTQLGEAHPGKEGIFMLQTQGDGIEAIRAWVGVKSAKGSVKGKANSGKKAGLYDVHLKLPKPLPKGSQLWISVENEDGDIAKKPIDLENDDGDEHKGHDHK